MSVWIGFSLAILFLLVISHRSLVIGMVVASISLAVFTLSLSEFATAIMDTLTDPSVLLLTLIVGLIPLIGGSLEVSGQMDRLVSNMRIGLRSFLAVSPALLGMLPMPGGALLSAPLVERGAPDVPEDTKAAANVWFRHALLMVYPLAPVIIASAKIASFDVYQVIPMLLPASLLAVLLGYWFLLRRVSGRVMYEGRFSLAGLLIPISIILVGPATDLLLKSTANLPYLEIATSIGVAVSLSLAVLVGRISFHRFIAVIQKMRPWRYSLIILAMFTFLNVFRASGTPEHIAELSLPPVVLCVVIGFLLAVVTGRIQTPVSIVVPIFVSTYGAMTPVSFAVTFFAIYLGYLITPIHPCVSVSVEYFSIPMLTLVKKLAPPIALAFIITLVVGVFVI